MANLNGLLNRTDLVLRGINSCLRFKDTAEIKDGFESQTVRNFFYAQVGINQ